jgi:hypothetical protein
MIARSTPAWGVVLPEFQPASAAPVERQAHAGLAEPPESAAAPGQGESRASAARPNRMAADPSLLEQQALSAIDLAIPIPSPGSPGDCRQIAVEFGRSERGWR